MVRLARERWVWRRWVRCSRAEKRCPACWAMLQESTVLSAVLDRTMFRFHRSTTWLDQAQRKAPRRLVRVKVRKQRQREDRSAQRKQRGAAEARAGPHRGLLVLGAGFHRNTSRDGEPTALSPHPWGRHRRKGGELTGGRWTPLTLELAGRTHPSQGN